MDYRLRKELYQTKRVRSGLPRPRLGHSAHQAARSSAPNPVTGSLQAWGPLGVWKEGWGFQGFCSFSPWRFPMHRLAFLEPTCESVTTIPATTGQDSGAASHRGRAGTQAAAEAGLASSDNSTHPVARQQSSTAAETWKQHFESFPAKSQITAAI
jgi:hypothetical protein